MKNKDYSVDVMKLKKAGEKESRGVANILSKDDLNTILGTADYFGCSEDEMRLIFFDLYVAKYRVFDWLSMAIQGRLQNQSAVKVFTYSFIKSKGVPSEFINDLQHTDYDLTRDWEQIKINNEREN